MWGVHHKARRLLADQIHEHNIRFLDTAANSPDLQPLETLHKYQKKELDKLRINTASAVAAVQTAVEKEIRLFGRNLLLSTPRLKNAWQLAISKA
jgi:hypothetical protein